MTKVKDLITGSYYYSTRKKTRSDKGRSHQRRGGYMPFTSIQFAGNRIKSITDPAKGNRKLPKYKSRLKDK